MFAAAVRRIRERDQSVAIQLSVLGYAAGLRAVRSERATYTSVSVHEIATQVTRLFAVRDSRDDVRDDLLPNVGSDKNHCVFDHEGVVAQRMFNLVEFNSVTAQLDLSIIAAAIDNRAVSLSHNSVTGTIEPRSFAKGMSHEGTRR